MMSRILLFRVVPPFQLGIKPPGLPTLVPQYDGFQFPPPTISRHGGDALGPVSTKGNAF